MRFGRFSITLAVAAVLLMISGPAFSVDSGTVQASVEPSSGPCVTVGTSTVDFGVVDFSTASANSTADSASYDLTSCSNADSKFDARGTDATSGTNIWSLILPTTTLICDDGADVFGMRVFNTTDTTVVQIDGTDRLVPSSTLTDGESISVFNQITMPCDTSSGAGEVFTTDIVYTAFSL